MLAFLALLANTVAYQVFQSQKVYVMQDTFVILEANHPKLLDVNLTEFVSREPSHQSGVQQERSQPVIILLVKIVKLESIVCLITTFNQQTGQSNAQLVFIAKVELYI